MTIVRKTAWLAAISTALAIFAMALIAALPGAPAWAAPGGIASTAPQPSPEPAAAAGKARLIRGRAVAPLDAPPQVREVIAAANRIRKKPYVWGGGHGRWWDRGYDCSGAVSYALRGGDLIDSPLPSGPLMRWGSPGRGKWITVYAHGGHTYAVIAGLRWDTSGTGGNGPRWSTKIRKPRGYVARHPEGL